MRGFEPAMLACLALVACNPDVGGGGTGTEGTETGSTGSTTAPTTLDATAEGSTAGSGGGSTGSSSSGVDETATSESGSTGPGCTPGDEGCTCIEGACDEGLTCVEDMCVVQLCGNGDVDAGEACDDANGMDSDGCDNDCTISAGAVQVIAGDEHVCALFHTGDIKCWGAFESGRLGYLNQDQDVGDDETPAEMPFVNVGAPVVQLALGSNFTCVLLDTEEVKCWGSGQHGRTGQGSQADLGTDEEPADIPPIDLGGGTPAFIAAGAEHACAVMQSGELRCWGRNDSGQLGLPGVVAVGDDEVPGDVPAIDLGMGVVADQVAAGADHTCALLDGGGVLCFGGDAQGQLGTPGPAQTVGDDEAPSASTPVLLGEEAVMIAGRFNHTCVAYDTGTIQCWGDGGAGRLGYGDTNNVGDDEDVSLATPVDPVGSNPTSFGMGTAHTCVRLGTTQIYCWGEGSNGRLGYGNTTDLLMPDAMQVNLALPLAPRMVTAGREFSCATTEGSEVKCWGRNNRGQLGYGVAWMTDLADNEPIDSVGPVMIE
jgi:cysteine-rich repeat protein